MKEYLGDAVYAEFDGQYIVLTTENERRTDNTIYLDLHVLDALDRFREQVKLASDEGTAFEDPIEPGSG
jgi:hypothetical protein